MNRIKVADYDFEQNKSAKNERMQSTNLTMAVSKVTRKWTHAKNVCASAKICERCCVTKILIQKRQQEIRLIVFKIYSELGQTVKSIESSPSIMAKVGD